MADETTGGTGAQSARDAASNANTPAPAPGALQGAPQSGAPSAMPPKEADAPMRADIAKILSEVQLPERRPAPAEAAPKTATQVGIPSALANLDQPIEGSAPTPEPAPAPAAPLPEADSSVVAMHTLKQDLQHVVRDQNISYVRAVALEGDKRRTEQEPIEEAPRRHSYSTGIIITAGVLLFVGLMALGGIYFAEVQNKAPLPEVVSDALVFAEQSVSFSIANGSPSGLKLQLSQARDASHASLGSITRIVPIVAATSSDGAAMQRAATFGEFMTAIGAHLPDDLQRALSDQFFLGLHTVDKNAPLIVVPIVSYDRAFASMLAWEQAMNGDLAPLFTPVPQYINQDGIPGVRTFTDVVMRNYDVRALKDDSGTIQLYYSFPTRGMLIIAESPYTFTEVLTRLQAQRRL